MFPFSLFFGKARRGKNRHRGQLIGKEDTQPPAEVDDGPLTWRERGQNGARLRYFGINSALMEAVD